MRTHKKFAVSKLYTLTAAFAAFPLLVSGQPRTAGVDFSSADYPPTNALPNPYVTHEDWFRMPGDREWGSTSAIDISPDGQYIWVAERCSANITGCMDNTHLDSSVGPPGSNVAVGIPGLVEIGDGIPSTADDADGEGVGDSLSLTTCGGSVSRSPSGGGTVVIGSCCLSPLTRKEMDVRSSVRGRTSIVIFVSLIMPP